MQDDGLKWLHESSVVIDAYNPKLLQPINRSSSRDKLSHLSFFGYDVWQAYEVSFLQPSGLPKVATLTFKLDTNSKQVVESKSLKLYLNSLNNHIFDSDESVYQTIKKDLAVIIGNDFELDISYPPFPSNIDSLPFKDWFSIDQLNIDQLDAHTTPTAQMLKLDLQSGQKTEKLYTQLFRANCLVTNQPDWATVLIEYHGASWDKKSLLAYLLSYRNHQSFHEQCIDSIFSDITMSLKPDKLYIQANFMRRGGIDITPVRSSVKEFNYIHGRDWRQ